MEAADLDLARAPREFNEISILHHCLSGSINEIFGVTHSNF